MDELFDLFSMVAEKPAAPKKEEKPKKTEKKADEPKEKKSTDSSNLYTYPFILHYAGRNLDISHIFTEGQSYSASEITKAMLEHQFYEFSGKVTYDYIQSDNVLVPIFQQHRKG